MIPVNPNMLKVNYKGAIQHELHTALRGVTWNEGLNRGWFHCWCPSEHPDSSGFKMFALIELPDGKMTCISAQYIKFHERPFPS